MNHRATARLTGRSGDDRSKRSVIADRFSWSAFGFFATTRRALSLKCWPRSSAQCRHLRPLRTGCEEDAGTAHRDHWLGPIHGEGATARLPIQSRRVCAIALERDDLRLIRRSRGRAGAGLAEV